MDESELTLEDVLAILNKADSLDEHYNINAKGERTGTRYSVTFNPDTLRPVIEYALAMEDVLLHCPEAWEKGWE